MNALPNSPYGLLLHELRRRLYDPRGSKAAVMIGAGFSKNALPISCREQMFPSWSELTDAMIQKLYPDDIDGARLRCGAVSGMTRLAEEYEWAFGRSSLIDLVRRQTDDSNYRPSKLHMDLVDLPWADIFTTNYDRLIESASTYRKADRLHKRFYDVVSRISDLPIAHSPRIIKLHGTLPDLDNLILTEEDFRKYPSTNAPLVNLVGQSLIENTFCLIGFSGDDPNFLAWTGWVRDVLTSSSPKILLITTDEKPWPNKGLLESRGIHPIPIRMAFKASTIDSALKGFFRFLAKDPELELVKWNRRPKWSRLGAKDREQLFDKETYEDRKPTWEDLIIEWRKSRHEYQGWVVLPATQVDQLQIRTRKYHQAIVSNNGFKTLTPHFQTLASERKLLIIREYAWRQEISTTPLDDRFVQQVVEPLLRGELNLSNGIHIENKDQTITISADECKEALKYVKLQLLRHAKETGSQKRFIELREDLGRNHELAADDKSFIVYQTIQWHLGNLQIKTSLELLSDWDPEISGDIWTLRRIALLLEFGQIKKCNDALRKLADRIVSQNLNGRFSVSEKSIEGVFLHLISSWNWAVEPSESQKAEDEHEQRSESEDKSRVPDVFFNSRANVSNSDSLTKSPPEKPIVSMDDVALRLELLSGFGCNPQATLIQFTDKLRYIPEIGESRASHSDHDEGDIIPGVNFDDAYWDCWQAVRFIDDSATPISIRSRRIEYNVAHLPWSKASAIISVRSLNEAIPLICRLRDESLLKRILDVSRVSRISDEELQRLFQRCIELLDYSFDNEEFDRDLRFSIQFLLIMLPVCSDEQLVSLSKLLIEKSLKTDLWLNRCQTTRLGKLLWITFQQVSCLHISGLEDLVMNLVVPENSLQRSEEIVTFNSADCFEIFKIRKVRTTLDRFSSQLSDLIDLVRKKQGFERTMVCRRLAYLLTNNRLTKKQISDFSDALFARIREDGFPSDSGLLDWVILALPIENQSKKILFSSYLHSKKSSPRFWTVLEMTVRKWDSLESPPYWSNIEWTNEEVNSLVMSSIPWVTELSKKHEDYQRDKERSFLSSIYRDEVSEDEIELLSWKRFISIALLNDDSAFDSNRDLAKSIYSLSGECNVDMTVILPSFCRRGFVSRDLIDEQIILSLSSENRHRRMDAYEAVRSLCVLESEGLLASKSEFWDEFSIHIGSVSQSEMGNYLDVFKYVAEQQFKTTGCVLVTLQRLDKILPKLISSPIDQQMHLDEHFDSARARAAKLAQWIDQNVSPGKYSKQLEMLKSDRFVKVRRALEDT